MSVQPAVRIFYEKDLHGRGGEFLPVAGRDVEKPSHICHRPGASLTNGRP